MKNWISKYKFKILLNFAPTDGFIRPGPAIAAIVLTGRVEEDTEVCSVPHQVCIADVMFDETTTNDYHACVDTVHCQLVDDTEITKNIND